MLEDIKVYIKYSIEVIHSTMDVNHMTCETLSPHHIIAKIYKRSGKEQAYILSVLDRLVKQKKLMNIVTQLLAFSL